MQTRAKREMVKKDSEAAAALAAAAAAAGLRVSATHRRAVKVGCTSGRPALCIGGVEDFLELTPGGICIRVGWMTT